MTMCHSSFNNPDSCDHPSSAMHWLYAVFIGSTFGPCVEYGKCADPTSACTSRLRVNRSQSVRQAISIAPLQVHYYSEALPTQHGYCVGVSRRMQHATVSEGHAQGPYVAARAGFKPATLRTKGVESTNAPSRLTEET